MNQDTIMYVTIIILVMVALYMIVNNRNKNYKTNDDNNVNENFLNENFINVNDNDEEEIQKEIIKRNIIDEFNRYIEEIIDKYEKDGFKQLQDMGADSRELIMQNMKRNLIKILLNEFDEKTIGHKMENYDNIENFSPSTGYVR